ncbi:hypothetical protein EMIHUDRAFT_106701 [Emiliania huxleyi CCMP1516]|uniref:cystathionine gamma-lyase n=2 Tax=Emiliania huxleyi TaxID=2903 RepID=A0A0D3I688_EMIH1|nr:hypothetical protein EMIHUDRAFT_106701 [Emiliania huxleyi CCMP1516]EOD06773.1 hypothetical protein EMIHUDRAFT_106701 [Emiliania huxleyi CCMP1516]|eukprot:XP_005759202.1 hypothetical protein EMIHUDRAFT_106701 [Emiliania huxleyi CCMP1516]
MLRLQLSAPPGAARRAFAALPRLAAARPLARPLAPAFGRAARALSAKPVDIDPSLLGDTSLSGAAGDGVPVAALEGVGPDSDGGCMLFSSGMSAITASLMAVLKARHAKPWVMCDSTFATPFHQRCLEVPGVDVAIHSATKYIGGHSDILAGAATAESGELLHGAATTESGEFLHALAKVFYPGLPSHPDHELAKRVFSSGAEFAAAPPNGMLAFIIAGDDETALRRGRRLCERLEVITLAVSLGGTESLIEHPPASDAREAPGGLRDGLVRLSALTGCDDGQ